MTLWIRWPEETGSWRWLAQALGMPALLATPFRSDMILPASRLRPAALARLCALLGGERVRCDPAIRLRHAGSSSADSLRLRGGNVSHVPDAVLLPRHEDDVLALLRLCEEEAIGVAPPGAGAVPGDAPVIALDLSDMTRLLSLDAVSGLAEFEAGITGAELEQRLAARGLSLGADMSTASLGAQVARGDGADWLQGVMLATPRGLTAGLKQVAPGSRGALGIITRATVRVHALPAARERRCYLFSDFAAGLTALRETRRQQIAHQDAVLSDGAATRFRRDQARGDARPWHGLGELRRRLRGFDHQAAALAVSFTGSAAEVKSRRKQFEAVVERLGAIVQPPQPEQDYPRETLLDRGVMLDSLRLTANWAELPGRYAAIRAALERAMRASAVRDGAHGLVLAKIIDTRHEGAQIEFTWVFARGLEDDMTQAQAIRQAALDAARPSHDALAQDVTRAIRLVLDPKSVLKPDSAP